MKKVKKFSIQLVPDSAQKVFQGYETVELDLDILTFNDKSVRVVIPQMSEKLQHRYCYITGYVESIDDLMIIAQAKSIIDQLSLAPKLMSLTLTSTAYSRYDRVMLQNKTDAFGAKAYADFINSLNFNFVSILDCHSPVLTSLINNCSDIPQEDCVKSFTETFINNDYDYIVAPDAGAARKMNSSTYSRLNGLEVVVASKHRDVETGLLSEPFIENSDMYFLDNAKVLIIDDISEYSGTLYNLAKVLKQNYNVSKVDTFVTHGLYPINNRVNPPSRFSYPLEFIDNIYCFNLRQIEENESFPPNVHAINLITG